MPAKLITNGLVLPYTPVSDVQKGTIVKLGSVIGVVNLKIEANKQGSVVLGHYWSCSRKSGAVFTTGDRAYVDLVTQEITDNPNDYFVGVYVSDNILSSNFVNIKFNEYFGITDTMDFVEVANYAALPVTGVLNTLYITIDNNKTFRWTGSVYVEVSVGASAAYAVYANLAGFPVSGDTSLFYVADDTEKLYRWTGAVYVEVSAGGGGSSRADASLSVAASAGFSVDMITAQNLIITMDAVFGGAGLKPAVNPTVDGQVLEITFKKTGTINQPVLDPAYFTDTGLDITLPFPLLNATINTEDVFRFKWSTTINKYYCVGFSRRYS